MLLIEKYLPLHKLPGVLRHGYVLLVVCISFVIFNAADMTQARQDLGGMFGFAGVPLISTQAVYYLRSYGVLLIVGILGSTPLVYKAGVRCLETWSGASMLVPVAALALLLVCTAYLVDGSFNPFLYFRF